MVINTLQEMVESVETNPDWIWRGTLDIALDNMQNMQKLSDLKLEVMDAEKLALARMALGKDSSFSTTSLWVPNDHVYDPKHSGELLILNPATSLIFRKPEQATTAHRMDRKFAVNEHYGILRQLASPKASEALKTGVLLVKTESYSPISSNYLSRRELPTDAFGQLDVTIFIFGEKTAHNYGVWLKEENGVSAVEHLLVNPSYMGEQNRQFAVVLQVCNVDRRSALHGLNYDLHGGNGRVRGVRYVRRELVTPVLGRK